LGGNQPVWIADPRDAQYLNTTAEELTRMAADLSRQGLLVLTGDRAAATPMLLERAPHYQEKMEQALAATKPEFNEEMRQGHTNM
jgi:sirohydrochlorin ferrochelatase